MISVITIKKNGLDEIAGDLRLVNAGFPVLNSKILGLIMPKMLVAKRHFRAWSLQYQAEGGGEEGRRQRWSERIYLYKQQAKGEKRCKRLVEPT